MTDTTRAVWRLDRGWRLSPLGIRRRAVLIEPYRVRDPLSRERTIPAGYTWDGPSLGILTDATATWSLVHDWTYTSGDRRVWTRRDADALARRIAIEHGDPIGASALFWIAVSPVLRLAWAMKWGGWGDLADDIGMLLGRIT